MIRQPFEIIIHNIALKLLLKFKIWCFSKFNQSFLTNKKEHNFIIITFEMYGGYGYGMGMGPMTPMGMGMGMGMNPMMTPMGGMGTGL